MSGIVIFAEYIHIEDQIPHLDIQTETIDEYGAVTDCQGDCRSIIAGEFGYAHAARNVQDCI